MFYKETDFHESSIGKIPKEWEAKATEDLFIIETGTTPSTAQEKYWKNGTVNWLTPTDLSKLNGKLRIRGSERKITDKALKETNLTLMPKGSIILSTRAPVGYVATLEEEATFNQGCKGLIPKRTNEVFSEYYTYYLSNKQKVLQNLSCGSTFLELSKNRLEQFSMPYLPVPEQRAIVGVLGVVDSALELADQVIAKSERLKRGLMQQLLTHGIRHTEYKQTPIGQIPDDWQVAPLGENADFRNGINFNNEQRTSTGTLTIDVRNMYEEDIYVALKDLYRVNIPDNEDCLLRKGDILFVRSSMKREGAGWASLFEGSSEPVTFCSFIIRARLKDQSQILPEFLTHYLRSDFARHKLVANAGQVAISNITQDSLNSLLFPIPQMEEQKKIAKILAIIDGKIRLEKIEKAKVERIKQALMDLLLTGKVRIKVD